MGTSKSMHALLAGFFALAADDPRVRAVHISLYLALLNEWQVQSFVNPVCIRREALMQTAKIKARYTYVTVINELQQWGYIRYLPSADPRVPSEVWFE